jgi:DNA-binding HxlR family transcriptional regulator
MVTLPRPPRSHCPINFGLEIFGDAWTLLVLRDLLIVGKSGFSEFLASEEGIATNILTDRLARLEAAGLITRERGSADRRQVIYRATDAGKALVPVLVEMSYWGAKHDPLTAAPPAFVAGYEADRNGLLRAIAAGFDPRQAGDPTKS